MIWCGINQRAGYQISANTTDRSHRDDARSAGGFGQRPDVGAVIDQMRRNGMSIAVARQKDHSCLPMRPKVNAPEGFAVRAYAQPAGLKRRDWKVSSNRYRR